MSQHPARLLGRRCGTPFGHGLIASHPRAERVRCIRRMAQDIPGQRGLGSSTSYFGMAGWKPSISAVLELPLTGPRISCRHNTTSARTGSLNSPPITTSTTISDGRKAVATRSRQRLVLRSGGFGIPKPQPPSTSPPSPLPTPTSSTSWPRSSTNPESLRITHGGTRAVQIGEDAYFFARSSMGVSDGVGGNKHKKRNSARDRPTYSAPHSQTQTNVKTSSEMEVSGETREERTDSARFSQLLMHFCAAEADTRETARNRRRKARAIRDIRRSTSSDEVRALEGVRKVDEGVYSGGEMDPIEIMQQAYEHTVDQAKIEGVLGSATCLLAVLDDEKLRIANLGDCALVVVRKGQIVFRTEEMQHGFNFPLQLGTSSKDEPMKDAQLFSVDVEKGDIVVMGSDGLSDNLFDEEILDVLSTFSLRHQLVSPDPDPTARSSTANRVKIAFTPQRVSEALCLAANSASRDVEGASPFMYKAIDRGYSFVGGKQDDISVVVALVDGI